MTRSTRIRTCFWLTTGAFTFTFTFINTPPNLVPHLARRVAASGFHFYIESWTSTLVALFNDGVVGCFTSHDLQDENKQWQWLTGCCDFETLLEPSTNPFR